VTIVFTAMMFGYRVETTVRQPRTSNQVDVDVNEQIVSLAAKEVVRSGTEGIADVSYWTASESLGVQNRLAGNNVRDQLDFTA
jgi:hypothetical protein